jgi:hypothetical protein
MCVLLKYIFFDFASEATLKDRANVLRFFSALVEDGEFYLADAENSDADSLAQAWQNANLRGPRNVWVRFENTAKFSVTFGIYGTDWRRWYAMVYDSAISSSANQANVRSLVKACEIAYKTLHPDYGYGLIALENYMLAQPGENVLSALYDYNFLSPRLVEQMGRRNLLAVPSWRKAEFDDGGLLLEMSPSPLVDKKSYRDSYQQAAQTLGLSQFYQGGS